MIAGMVMGQLLVIIPQLDVGKALAYPGPLKEQMRH